MQPNTNLTVGQLDRKLMIAGYIKAITGLHIGGSNQGLSIGGVDATVIRNALSGEPYIPGSSLKGKMRSLLERAEGKWSKTGMENVKNGPYVEDPRNPICQIFGLTPESLRKAGAPEQPVSRLIVRDCPLTRASARQLEGALGTDLPFTEVKTEVGIDRITSAANPRSMERVPAGAVFRLRLILNLHQGDDANTLLGKVFESLALLQNDYLGGKGTRGCGEVVIRVGAIKQKTIPDYEAGRDWQPFDGDAAISEALRLPGQPSGPAGA